MNPIRYRGYYLDSETGYYYLGSRYYDPEIKRFISEDEASIPTLDITSFYDKNLYAYCDDNPANKFDVNGYWGFTIAGAFIGGILNASLTVFTNYLAGNNLTDGIAGAIVSGAISGAISTCPLLRSINGHKIGKIASAVGAVAGTVAEEVMPYINGKDITKDNLIESGLNIIGNGIRNVITDVTLGELAGDIVPANNWWFRPKKLKTILTGNYTMKVLRQSLLNTFYSFIPSGIEAYYGNQ